MTQTFGLDGRSDSHQAKCLNLAYLGDRPVKSIIETSWTQRGVMNIFAYKN